MISSSDFLRSWTGFAPNLCVLSSDERGCEGLGEGLEYDDGGQDAARMSSVSESFANLDKMKFTGGQS